MTRIERRQARLATIRDGLLDEGPGLHPVTDAELSDSRYIIGSTQNRSLDLNSWFLDSFPGTIHQDKYLLVRLRRGIGNLTLIHMYR